MILVDANILMYAAGAAHANRSPSVRFLEMVALGEVEAALDAEVLQEVLHRYRAIGRWSDGRLVFDGATRIFSVVFPVSLKAVARAREVLEMSDSITARDAIHAGVVDVEGLDGICSFDRGFDQIEIIRRVEPSVFVS